MTTLKIIRRDGAECILDVTDGKSIMETLRDHGVDDLLALCGGCCSCATCHIYVDPQYAVGLPPMSDDENDLRSEEHTSELQSLMRISYAVFCLKKKNIRLTSHSLDEQQYHLHK